MANKLPTHRGDVIIDWGVCEPFADAGVLKTILGRQDLETNAREICELDKSVGTRRISAGDKLWMVMRKEFTPDEVLERVADRILALKDIPQKIKDDVSAGKTDRKIEHEMLKEALAERAKGTSYWDVICKVAATLKYAGIASYNQAYTKMLDIYLEELTKWEKEG